MTFSSQFMLVAATDPTPDGKCPANQDLHVEVSKVKFRESSGDRTGETSAQIRERVVAARKRLQTRFAHTCNARMGPKELEEFCVLDDGTKELLKTDVTRRLSDSRRRQDAARPNALDR